MSLCPNICSTDVFCQNALLLQIVLREAENAGHTLDLESKSSASDMTSPMSPQVSRPFLIVRFALLLVFSIMPGHLHGSQ